MKKVTFALMAILLIASGCTLKKQTSEDGSYSGLDLTKSFTAEQLRTATVTAAKVLLQRLPTETELDKAAEGTGSYEAIIRGYLNDPAFLTTMKSYHHSYFEMGGTTTVQINGTDTTLNFNEPINLAVKIIRDNLDYRQIALYPKCVDDELNDVDCTTYASEADPAARAALQTENAAGVLTTQAFMQKWSASFNFRRVNKAFSVLACAEYPDIDDPGMAEGDLGDDQGRRDFANSDTSTGLTNCYSCHRTVNSRATMYFNYDRNGLWTTNLTGSTPHPDGGSARVTQILKEGVQPTYHGEPINRVRDYATMIANGDKFKTCMVQRFRAFVFGKSHLDPLPDAMLPIVDKVEETHYNVREVLAAILTHHLFIQR